MHSVANFHCEGWGNHDKLVPSMLIQRLRDEVGVSRPIQVNREGFSAQQVVVWEGGMTVVILEDDRVLCGDDRVGFVFGSVTHAAVQPPFPDRLFHVGEVYMKERGEGVVVDSCHGEGVFKEGDHGEMHLYFNEARTSVLFLFRLNDGRRVDVMGSIIPSSWIDII